MFRESSPGRLVPPREYGWQTAYVAVSAGQDTASRRVNGFAALSLVISGATALSVAAPLSGWAESMSLVGLLISPIAAIAGIVGMVKSRRAPGGRLSFWLGALGTVLAIVELAVVVGALLTLAPNEGPGG